MKIIRNLVASFFIVAVAYGGEPVGEDQCALCDPKIIKKQVFYEGELVRVFYDYKPIFPGHCLIVPKRHVRYFHEISLEEGSEMCATVKKLHRAIAQVFQKSDYVLIQKNGLLGGQTVDHVHIHYVPPEIVDPAGGATMENFVKCKNQADKQGPISQEEVAKYVQLLKEAFEQG
ncbi:MAG: HIT family protein [Chlamydiota bacterium]